MERIVFLDRDTLRAEVRRPAFAHEWAEYGETAESEAAVRLTEATIAITNKVPLRAAALAGLPRLKLIAVAATGTDIVDLRAARERGISVSNVRGYAQKAVPEHVFALAFALSRSLFGFREDLEGGLWQSAPHFCLHTRRVRDLGGRTLGIVGYGSLGRAVASLAQAFGMKVLIAERKRAERVREGRRRFEEVLNESDVLTLHAPLTEETRGMIGAEELGRMRADALLINCGRGGLVDESALVEALRGGVIAGAGVDVLTEEPPRNGNPLLDARLPNLLVTPHVAWASTEAMQTLADQLIDNLEAFVRGQPRNLVIGEQ